MKLDLVPSRVFSECFGHVGGLMQYCGSPMRSDVPNVVRCGN